MKRISKRICSAVVAVSMCLGVIGLIPDVSTETVLAEESVTQNISIDINGSENRGNLKSPVFEDWTLTGNKSPATYTSNGVEFTLTSSKGSFDKSENKTLITGGYTPYLTCDGASIETDGASITLEIKGLSAGTHTITTWHSYYRYNATALGQVGSLSIMVNGEEKSKVTPTPQTNVDLEAGIGYTEFNVTEGQPVTITIQQAADSTGYDKPVLNAFEIDGAHPTLAIKNVVPEDKEGHHDPEKGLSWEAGEGAVAHDVYFGNDKYLVSSATTESAEYKGRQTETTYKFTEELSHMETYYWRIDEIDSNGNVVKGKTYYFQVRHLAFPTAEGYGRFAKGGRGGRVIEVTTLEDNNEPGSLRYALEVEKGPRIVVFRVGGVIELKDTLCIPADGGNVYVAGQTAPGDGITLIKQDFGTMGSSDVIIRNVRVRVGDSNGHSTGGMGLASSDHCIVDHCSISWSTDEGFSSRQAKNITFQWNIIAEALHMSVHYKDSDRTQTENHSFAGSISGNIGSFHHNLLAHCAGRNWSLAGGIESDNKTYAGYLDITNNVVYNFRDRTTDGGVRRVNFVGNYYKGGPESPDMNMFWIDGNQMGFADDIQMAYVSANKMTANNGKVLLDVNEDAWAKGYAKASDRTGADSISTTPFFPSYVNTQSADDAYDSIVASNGAGAIYPARDYLDARYVDETINTTFSKRGSKENLKGIIDSQEDAGGYPNEATFKSATVTDDFDTDHDGMPNEWETAHGLNPDDSADGSVISLSAEGYTNVEMYLNELMGDPLVWADGSQTGNATPKPVETTTPNPIETATPKPTATVTPEVTESINPTTKPSDDEKEFVIGIENANNAATVDGTVITFTDPANATDGVLLDNSFIGKDTSNGLAISFWFTPSESVSGKLYTYRSIFTAVNAADDMAIKYDFEGTRQLASSTNKLNYWEASIDLTADTEYFITYVVKSTGLEYYVNGKNIGYSGYAKNLEVPSRAAAMALFSTEGTKLYAGGYSGVIDSLQGDSRLFDNKVPEGTIMRDFKGYLGTYSDSDIMALYEAELAGDTKPVETATPEPTPIVTATPAPTPVVTDAPVETATPVPTAPVTEVPTATPEVTDVPVTDTPEPVLLGDVNKDGVINATDALLVLKHAAKLEILSDDLLIIADINEDESIDAKDALQILKIAAKLI